MLGAAAVLLAGSLALAPLLGTRIHPDLDEGTINLDVLRVPSISLDNAVKDAGRAEKAMLELPEVTRVVSRIGRPELATDTAGPDESDVYVFLKPHEQWRVHDREELIGEMEKKLAQRIPETRYAFSQPIENSVNDMIAGIKGDVAIHIYGDDFDRMLAYGQRCSSARRHSRAPPTAKWRRAPGLPSLNIAIDREAVARYGINAGDVLDTIETMGGRIVGQVVEGDARYLLQVRFAQPLRKDIDRLDDIQVAAPDGKLIPLAQLAHFTVEEGPVAIWRENLTRRVTVAVNVRGTDLGSFVSTAQTHRRARSSRCLTDGGWNGADSMKICSAPRPA